MTEDYLKIENSADFVEFLGWMKPDGIYAGFKIDKKSLSDQYGINSILVAHEGRFWIEKDGMRLHKHFDTYEEVQQYLGSGLTFVEKSYVPAEKCCLFKYAFDGVDADALLAVPATGEEIEFRIYGLDGSGKQYLLLKREL